MRVLVAMSGGVDSSVAATLLHDQGHTVVGVHMLLHDGPAVPSENPKSCCGTRDAMDARKVAQHVGFSFDVMDMTARFKTSVLDNFRSELASGRTPIPCTHCNGDLKFNYLFSIADTLDCDAIATGHYARMIDGEIHRAVDENKDQSYFLWTMNPDRRRRVIFPIGGMTKAEVRAYATSRGLTTADKPESQNLCFVPPGMTSAQFYESTLSTGGPTSGTVVDLVSNQVVGKHPGTHHFTVGQRKGFGSVGYTAHVARIDASTQTIYVGPVESSLSASTTLANVIGLTNGRFDVRTRHRAALVPATITGDDSMTVHFDTPTLAAPGQALVAYDGTRLVGGGWIR